jgi:hypothetical protein
MAATWMDTRLAVILNGDTKNPVSPIDSFTPTFALTTEVVHSIEATHIGYISNPENFTFTMTVKAIGDSAATLMRIAMDGDEFEVGMYEAADGAGEWDFKSVILRNCLITSANPSNATINGAPTATFSGVARKVETSDGNGDPQMLPTFTS